MVQRNRYKSKKLPAGGKDFNFFNSLTLLTVLSSLSIAPFIFDSFVAIKIMILYLGLLVLGILIFRNRKRSAIYNRLPSWLIMLLIALVAILLLSTKISETPVIRSMFGQFGRGNGLFYYFGALLLFFLTAISYRIKYEPRFTKTLTSISIILTFYTILQSLGIDFAKLDTKGLSPVVLTFGNSNFAGGMLAVLFAFIFTRSFKSKKVNYLDFGISISLFCAIILAGAVQGYLIVALTIFIVVPIRIVSASLNRYWRKILYVFWGTLSIGFILGAAGFGPMSVIFERRTFQIRMEYWSIGLKILRDHLLFGVGPDRLFDITPSYMTPGSLKLVTTTSIDNPHNWFLHFGCSFGLPALLLLLAIILYPVIDFVRQTNLRDFLANYNTPTFMALSALVFDGLVSIEQIGLGIWMYFFAGKILAANLSKRVRTLESPRKQIVFEGMQIPNILIVFLLAYSFLGSAATINRFVTDALLRSNIQKVLLGELTPSNFRKIETLAIRLKSEPEYAIQSLPLLAKNGNRQSMLNVSKAFFEYNHDSLQVLSIRFEVLDSVTSIRESCEVLPQLISVTPWDDRFVEKFLLCQAIGLKDSRTVALLKLVENYIDISFPENFIDNQDSGLLGRASRARLEFELGRMNRARLLQQQIEVDLKTLKLASPDRDLTRAEAMIDF